MIRKNIIIRKKLEFQYIFPQKTYTKDPFKTNHHFYFKNASIFPSSIPTTISFSQEKQISITEFPTTLQILHKSFIKLSKR